ncbi:MAG: CoA transferase [Chloroflexi bacterium]|nr:CoA transferase [Chloroflexota bacterium]
MVASNGRRPPIRGMRVLDLAGPEAAYGGKMLAELGADVIKIEPPGGDGLRWRGPFDGMWPERERSLSFAYHNASKRSVTLDITSGLGRRLFLELLNGADALLESFAPGYMASLGLGHEDLREIKPDFIYTALTPFGQTGPHRGFQGTDLTVQAMGGLSHRVGFPDGPPFRMGGEQAYLMGSAHVALATLIAWHDRAESGEGQFIDVSMQEAVAMTGQDAMPLWDLRRQNLERVGFKSMSGWRHVYPVRDGYIKFMALYVRVGPGLKGVVDWMASHGMAGWLADAEMESLEGRRARLDEIEEQINAFTRTMTRDEAVREGRQRGFMIMPINTIDAVVRDEQLAWRKFFVDVALNGHAVRYPGPPVRLSRTPWQPSCRPPRIGEHNEAVYQGELGLSRGEMRALRAAGAT